MKTVRYYDTPFEAEVARGKLESEGITAIVQNENLGSVIPWTGAIQSLKPYIAVRDEDLLSAAEILGTDIRGAEEARRCPECGSEEIAFRFWYKDRPMKAFAYLAVLLLALINPGNIRRAYNCRKCGNWF